MVEEKWGRGKVRGGLLHERLGMLVWRVKISTSGITEGAPNRTVTFSCDAVPLWGRVSGNYWRAELSWSASINPARRSSSTFLESSENLKYWLRFTGTFRGRNKLEPDSFDYTSQDRKKQSRRTSPNPLLLNAIHNRMPRLASIPARRVSALQMIVCRNGGDFCRNPNRNFQDINPFGTHASKCSTERWFDHVSNISRHMQYEDVNISLLCHFSPLPRSTLADSLLFGRMQLDDTFWYLMTHPEGWGAKNVPSGNYCSRPVNYQRHLYLHSLLDCLWRGNKTRCRQMTLAVWKDRVELANLNEGGPVMVLQVCTPGCLSTLSLPSPAINFKLPLCSLTRNITSHRIRTWLFIAYSDERWLYYQFSLPHPIHFSLKVGRTYILNLRVEGLIATSLQTVNKAGKAGFFVLLHRPVFNSWLAWSLIRVQL